MKTNKIITIVGAVSLCASMLLMTNVKSEGLEIGYQNIAVSTSVAPEEVKPVEVEPVEVEPEITAPTATIKSDVAIKITNPFDEEFFNVKLSYYSEKEATNVKGHESKTALGQTLFNDVIAVPNEIPLYSLFLVEDEFGKQRVYIALDRGNPKFVKMLNDGEFKMKIDVYVKGASAEELDAMGLDGAKAKILRKGPEDMTSFEENKEFVTMLNKKLKNGESIESYFIKKEIVQINE